MKICFDYQAFAAQPYGGISRYFCTLASELAKIEGVHSRILAPLHINRYLHDAPAPLRSGIYLSPGHNIDRMMQGANRMAFNVCARIAAPDIIHETYYSPKPCGPNSAKRVISVFDMIHELFPESFAPGDRTHVTKRAAIKRADHIICISQRTKTDLMNILDIPNERISVILLAARPFPRVATPLPSLPSTKPFILHVGSRAGYKNFARLLKAYSHSNWLKNNFNIVCFGGGKLTPAERAIMTEASIPQENVVQMVGDDTVLAQLYRHAAVFCYPSIYEGFGIPPLEAMSEGCPVVCSNAGSVPEVVGDAAIQFDPLDTEAMRHALERVLQSSDLQAKLIASGYKQHKIFSWEKCARETLAVYEKVMK